MPHKVSIRGLVDTIDQTAESIGAINTVVNHNGSLTGYNTDWLGILRPLERATSLEGKKVAILGAGGAAQAAIFASHYARASVTIFNRTSSTAETLAHRFRCSARNLSDSNALRDFDIIINTTSLGMYDTKQESPVPPEALHPHHIVFETIYAPSLTTLLKDAQEAGAKIIRGAEMFLEQGIAQFEIHTGVKAPREVMENIISSTLSA
jgi:shikimate dehydrogenase